MANFSEKQMNAELFRCFSFTSPLCRCRNPPVPPVRTAVGLHVCRDAVKIIKFFSGNSKKDIHLFLTFVETAETVCRGKSAAVLKG